MSAKKTPNPAAETFFLQGNEACVRGALYAGVRFFAGYPITPSSEIAESLSELLPKAGGTFIQMEDEISSMCAVCGAALTGVKAMTATSGPGFSLKQEAIGYAVMAEIPCVVVDVQRAGPSTGLATHVAQGDVNQARWGTHGDHAVVVLTASSIQDVFAMTVEAFNISETYRTPVILLLDEVTAELDSEGRHLLFDSLINRRAQVFAATAEPFGDKFPGYVYTVSKGRVIEIDEN